MKIGFRVPITTKIIIVWPGKVENNELWEKILDFADGFLFSFASEKPKNVIESKKLFPNKLLYVDNGCYSLRKQGKIPDVEKYIQFVNEVNPDWYPIPVDYMPLSKRMTKEELEDCYNKTMEMNFKFAPKGFVPVYHFNTKPIQEAIKDLKQLNPPRLAVGGFASTGGGISPFHISTLRYIREHLPNCKIHFFGAGLPHIRMLSLIGVDSIDTTVFSFQSIIGNLGILSKLFDIPESILRRVPLSKRVDYLNSLIVRKFKVDGTPL